MLKNTLITTLFTLGCSAAAPAALVTIVLSDHLGNVVVPIENQSVPGLTPYPGRHSFDARTGGATANQDVRNVISTYDGNAVTYDILGPNWQEVHNQSWTPQVVSDASGEWLRVGAAGVNSQGNNVSWDQAFGGSYSSVTHSFEIRLSAGNPGANDGADGFGWRYTNSLLDGSTGAFYVAGEEPNLAGTLGVGFDIWNNGAIDNDATTSLSLHWDGLLLNTVNLQTEVSPAFSLETGEPIQVSISITEVIPEPASTAFLALGLLGVMRRRRVRC